MLPLRSRSPSATNPSCSTRRPFDRPFGPLLRQRVCVLLRTLISTASCGTSSPRSDAPCRRSAGTGSLSSRHTLRRSGHGWRRWWSCSSRGTSRPWSTSSDGAPGASACASSSPQRAAGARSPWRAAFSLAISRKTRVIRGEKVKYIPLYLLYRKHGSFARRQNRKEGRDGDVRNEMSFRSLFETVIQSNPIRMVFEFEHGARNVCKILKLFFIIVDSKKHFILVVLEKL